MRKIIMNCDTGGDDASAIALAVASEELELLGVGTVLGNLPLELTYRNTRELIGYLGTDTPVLKGSAAPLLRERWVGSERDRHLPFPGGLPELCPEREEDAVEWMARILRESEEKITLVPLAPLTDIAKLMLFYPDLVNEKVEEIKGRIEDIEEYSSEMNSAQRGELRDIKDRLAQIEAKKSISELERFKEDVLNLWREVYVDRFDFWAGNLAYLYKTRNRLPNTQEVTRLFDQGARAMEMKDKESVRRCVIRLWDLSPRDVVEEAKRGHGSGVTI